MPKSYQISPFKVIIRVSLSLKFHESFDSRNFPPTKVSLFKVVGFIQNLNSKIEFNSNLIFQQCWFQWYFAFFIFSGSFSGIFSGIFLVLVAIGFSPTVCSFNKNNSFTVSFEEFWTPFRNTFLKENLKMVASKTILFFILME